MKNCLFIAILFSSLLGYAQQPEDSVFLSKISNEALTNRNIMKQLKHLCDTAPGRLMGSRESEIAIKYLKSQLDVLKPDICFMLEYQTSSWQHHSTKATVISKGKSTNIHALALGPSIATSPQGIEAEVIEVASIDDIQKLGRNQIEGKIVFINHIMNDAYLSPSMAYREAVKGRLLGAPEAAKYGAKATIIRSLTHALDTFPHTGKTTYNDTIVKIPIAAMSTVDAELIHKMLLADKALKMKLIINAENLPNIATCNIIADIKGTEKPDEYILFGAHMDAWYNTQGAHDDGAGCVQVIEALRIFKQLGYKNKRTLRFVLYMDEELSQTGGEEYAKYTEKNKLKHIAAIESDAGALAPKSFAIDASDKAFENLNKYSSLFLPYGINSFYKGGTDVDIERLKRFNVPLIGNKPNTHRYFDYHHSGYDTFDKVNFRELQFNTINLTGLIYLIDKYGLE